MFEEFNPFEREGKSPSDAGRRIADGNFRGLGSCCVNRSKIFTLPDFVWTHVFQVKSPPDVLYRRDAMQDVEKQLNQAGDYVLLYGLPGCGKSICAFLHAVSLSNRPNVRRILWIDTQHKSYFLIHRGSVMSCEPNSRFSVLSERNDFTDVYVDQITLFAGLSEVCDYILPWSLHRAHHRKVTIILSDMYHGTIGGIRWKAVQIRPWSLYEYEDALSFDEFRNSFINHHELSPDLTKEQMIPYIHRHFYFAGGSARLFFHQCTDLAIKSVEKLAYMLPVTWFDVYEKFEPRQFISSYAVMRLGLRLWPGEFVHYILLLDRKFAHCYFEAFVLSCLANDRQLPRDWGFKLYAESIRIFDGSRLDSSSIGWFLPRRDKSGEGVTCFITVPSVGVTGFIFIFATTAHQYHVDTNPMMEVVAELLAVGRKPDSILVEVLFAIPEKNVGRFQAAVTGDWSGLDRFDHKFSNISHTIRIWPVSGCDRFLNP